jgi:ketosteroid isomerase-like protein
MKILGYLAWCASALTLAFGQDASKAASRLSAADERAIRAASKAYEQAGNKKDWSGVSAVWSEDIVFMPPNGPAQTGRKEGEAAMKNFPAYRDLKLEPVDIEGRGDLAYVRGRYSFVFGESGQTDTGKYIEIWKKSANGEWKYTRGIFNSDLPPPPATLSAADVAAIRAVNEAYRKTALAQQWGEWAKLFTTDAVMMPPNGTVVTGRANIEAWGRAFPRYNEFQNPVLELEGGGNVAIARGTYTLGFPAAPQPIPKDTGKWLATLRKQADGSWKFNRCCFNSDLPAVAAPGDPWLGTWVLNVAKTRINPGTKPRSETRTYSTSPDGEHATYDAVNGEGKRTSSFASYKFDGKDAPLIGDPDEDSMALTRTSPRSIAAVVKKDGQVIRTATREVSEDGKTLTVQFKGKNSKGQPIIEEVWVFDRKK